MGAMFLSSHFESYSGHERSRCLCCAQHNRVLVLLGTSAHKLTIVTRLSIGDWNDYGSDFHLKLSSFLPYPKVLKS